MLNKYGVKHYSTYSKKKGSIVERLNRTLKTRLYRVFSEKGNYRWLDMLPDLVKYYNKVNRTIGMKPSQVKDANEHIVMERINKNTVTKIHATKRDKFKTGNHVLMDACYHRYGWSANIERRHAKSSVQGIHHDYVCRRNRTYEKYNSEYNSYYVSFRF